MDMDGYQTKSFSFDVDTDMEQTSKKFKAGKYYVGVLFDRTDGIDIHICTYLCIYSVCVQYILILNRGTYFYNQLFFYYGY